MTRSHRESTDDLLVPAAVLGAFGVTPTDIGREPADGDSLEAALADALAAGVDRTTVLRRTITGSDRGLACPARYSASDLESELVAVFESIGWSLVVTHTRDGVELAATDPRGRCREGSVSYPETPLGTDNLPAVLWAISEDVLAGTDARFVLLSSGVDRWRAALVEASELERLRERYGPRIEAVDRPLLPEHGLEAYVPAATTDSDGGIDNDGDPWPPWALEPDSQRSTSSTTVTSLIDEAEPAARAEPDVAASNERSCDAAVATPPADDTAGSSTSAPSSEIDGFELRGTPDVSRTRTDDIRPTGSETTENETTEYAGDRPRDGSSAEEFGTLSGTGSTARVTNDSFGATLERQSEADRFRALGAALDAGGTVSVRGLLEDEDFLPTLPAAEPDEVRIEFADGCGPVEVPDTTVAAERSGFEWVDTGSLEPTRVSNG
ncbi:hypothetical protein [Natrinema sp. 1APR25-10V2]|uniref:hypothetical protein n=1 Tax=Natrinema sp. 1APR25-10V2 TaxID=2951081 RepID=UPI002875EEA2|nr:hypothetical protein [Natrinema sp. 1APR25-10V2]MDS0476396.1 hypothetical protein [Natrinema sp. 1APR25-10V2]